MTTILVTGATGFVGRALCPVLAASGATVIACTRKEETPDGASEVRLVRDICDEAALGAAMEGVDIVIHLTARAHIMRDDSADPLAEYRRINVEGTAMVARIARDAKVRRIVYLSSIKVNGERSGDQPYRASDTPAPEDFYGLTKHEAEEALRDIAGEAGLEWVVLRPPLVYGPGVRANFLSLMSLADSAWPLPFGAVTENRRSLIFIGNLTSALAAAATHPEAVGKTFLIRDGEDFSTAQLIEGLRAALGRPRRLMAVPPALLKAGLKAVARGAMADRLLESLAIDDAPIRGDLGWSPPFETRAALELTAGWYQGKGPKGQVDSQ